MFFIFVQDISTSGMSCCGYGIFNCHQFVGNIRMMAQSNCDNIWQLKSFTSSAVKREGKLFQVINICALKSFPSETNKLRDIFDRTFFYKKTEYHYTALHLKLNVLNISEIY